MYTAVANMYYRGKWRDEGYRYRRPIVHVCNVNEYDGSHRVRPGTAVRFIFDPPLFRFE